jgi:regulator of protease activity HflC (stomatin/prohibitin superfamily)
MQIKLIFTALAGVALLIVALMFSYTIDQQERGVLLRNGAVVGIAQPGRGYKVPLIDTVVEIPVNQRTILWSGKSALEAYSKDLQPAHIGVSVTYAIDPTKVGQVYSEFGGVDGVEARIINRVVPQELKTTFGQFTATSAISDRARMNSMIRAAISAAMPKDAPLTIENITVEDIKFSEAFEKSIEQRMLAEVQVEQQRQVAHTEEIKAQIAVTQAKGRADSALAEAEASAKAVILKGEAEAKAIKARGDALKESPNLVALTQAERWDGKLPTTMIPGGTVPMLQGLGR